MKKLLILGGSGFVGNSVVDYLTSKNLNKDNIKEIFILSRKIKSNKIKLNNININYVNQNIINLKRLPEVDFIIYCIKSRDLKTSDIYFKKFQKLLKSLKKKPNILFTSSGAVYGVNNVKRRSDEDDEINLESINKFSNYKKKYAKEKLFLEEKFKNLGKKNYKVSIARCFAFTGKHILKYDYAIANIINNFYSKSPVKLKTNKPVYRSYMHANDLSNWLLTILKNSNKLCPIYNIGSDKEIELKKLIKKIASKFGKKNKFQNYTTQKIDYYVPSINKAQKNLKLKITINLNHSINSTIKSL